MKFTGFWARHKQKAFKKKYKVGLCLSGGGAKGFVHLGVFKAFEEYGIKFDMVAGTSVGSLFGAMYASGISYEEMYKYASMIQLKDIKKSKLGFLPSKTDGIVKKIEEVVPAKRIEELPIPFFAVAANLKNGQEINFSKGELAPILAGSCAVPGIYLPVKYEDMLLIDGMVCNNVPADVLRENGCDFVVTVDCNPNRGSGTASKNMLSQFMASVGIMMASTSSKGLKNSDIIISADTRNYKAFGFKEKERLIELGYKAAKEEMEEIQKLFMGKKDVKTKEKKKHIKTKNI